MNLLLISITLSVGSCCAGPAHDGEARERLLIRLEANPISSERPRVYRNEQGEVTQLRFDRLTVTSADIEVVASIGTLKSLSFQFCKISNDDLKKLQALPNLKGLRLDFTNVTDEGLKHVMKLSSLRTLCMRGSLCSPEAVNELRKEKPILGIGYRPLEFDAEGKPITP